MSNNIPYTSFSGKSQYLCEQGNAVEFIQPWYTPISTTPENTGMAIGGIGNTFTLTALGNTPNFSFIPGIFIDNNQNTINFNDFYVAVSDEHQLDDLAISDLDGMHKFIRFYPAVFDGSALEFNMELAPSERANSVLTTITRALSRGQFYGENQVNFVRWDVEFTSNTLRSIQADPASIRTQILVALDFFNGLLVNSTTKAMSLTALKRASLDEYNIESIDAENIDYQALYPMAEYRYAGIQGIEINRKVVSPIVRGDKKLCSLPVHWNDFTIKNNSAKTQLVTLVQPLRNLLGSTYQKSRSGVQDSCCVLSENPIKQVHSHLELETEESVFTGVRLGTDSPYSSDIDGEIAYGIQANRMMTEQGKLSCSVKPMVYRANEQKSVYQTLHTGRANGLFDAGIYTQREAMSAMVSVQIELAANESIDVRFVQAMDHSKIMLKDWLSEKAYAQFYDQQDRVVSILNDVLPQIESIEAAIVSQQSEFHGLSQANIESDQSASQYSTMAMNTLSFLAESTVWDVEDKFLVKECVDYPFFNSLDVYFYGSYSLLYLLPELDGCVMRHFAKAILDSDETTRRFWEYEDKPSAELVDAKYEGIRAIRGAVIHDLGSPFDIQPDAYSWHNVKEWKDLAPKYILMVYRHYQQTGDVSVIVDCWQAIEESLQYLQSLVAEGDALPLTRGTDDTFDNLASHGISIYCASLWAAGLKVAAKMAKIVELNDLATQYQQQSSDALQELEESLWDEEKGYFHFFVTPIQTKHLTGIGFESLTQFGVILTGDKITDKNTLNHYLNRVDPNQELGKLEQRLLKKRQLVEAAPLAFTPEYQEILVLDSDNSFGDALLADSYLKLLGDTGLFSEDKISRALDYVYQQNFKVNSPRLGVANMTLADGSPHDAFQAQDVWTGVQFSVATALRLAGKVDMAVSLMDTVYDALYQCAKIPFAAPEGFNSSVAVTQSDVMVALNVNSITADTCLQALISNQDLLVDGRVSPNLSGDFSVFSEQLLKSSPQLELTQEDARLLHDLLLTTGLKYTAGRYFRPGMIFAYLPNIL